MSDKFGINTSEIKNTISDLKTAKLKQDKDEYEMDTTKKGDEFYGNYLTKKDNSLAEKAIDSNKDGIIDDIEKKNALRDTGKKYGAWESTQKKELNDRNVNSQISSRANTQRLANAREGRAARAEKRVNKKIEKAETDLIKYADAVAKKVEANGGSPNDVEVAKQRILNKKTAYDKTFGDYTDTLDVTTKIESLNKVGETVFSAQTPKEGNEGIKEINDAYIKALEQKNTKLAGQIKEIKDMLPIKFDEQDQQGFDNKKGEVLATISTEVGYLEAKRDGGSNKKLTSAQIEVGKRAGNTLRAKKEKDMISYAKDQLKREGVVVEDYTDEQKKEHSRRLEDAIELQVKNPTMSIPKAYREAGKKKQVKSPKFNNKTLGKSTLKEGKTGTHEGRSVITRNGKWVYND